MMSGALYGPIFLYSVIILTVIAGQYAGTSFRTVEKGQRNFYVAALICAVFAVWIGMRPVSGYYFGDTANYAHLYHTYQSMKGQIIVEAKENEWLWTQLMYNCSKIMSVSEFFTLIDIGYFGFTLWACKRLTPNNVFVAILFCMGAFSFFTYGSNGIRNGLGCSLVLLFISFLKGNRFEQLLSLGIAWVGYSFHNSVVLPILTALVSQYVIKSFKQAYIFWILSIFLSLLFGNEISNIFADMGFDDRLSYLSTEQKEGVFSHSGFRWDFLIYSMMPIVLGYYIVITRKIKDKTYLLLLNTYTLANAFWVMVIRANYSNRFAYLSWFMYPLVLAYPLLKLNIWGDYQGKGLRQIMYAQVAFTWFMQTFYWS